MQQLLVYAEFRPPAMAVVALHLCRTWAACPEAAACFTDSLRRMLLYDTDVRLPNLDDVFVHAPLCYW